MKTLKNRIIPGIMAGVLALSMAVPTFAVNNTVVTGTYQDIEISVTVPGDTTATINPYGMPVKIGEASGSTATPVNVSGEQVVSLPMFIVNQSEVNVTVGAKVTATLQGDLKLTDTAPAADDVLKDAFVYLQVAKTALDNNKKQNSASDTNSFSNYLTKDDATVLGEIANWKQAYNASKDVLLTSIALGNENKNMITLKAVDGSTKEVVAGGIAKARLAGKVSTDPTKPWATTDGFKATIAWIIKPDTITGSITGETAIDNSGSTRGSTTLTAALVGAPEDVTIKSVVWTSSDTTNAKIDVTPGGTGVDSKTATVAAKIATGGASAGDGDFTITATITASNDIVYTATTSVTVSGTPD